MGVDSYSIDKRTDTTNKFKIQLHNKGQQIRNIGFVGHYQNGVVQNAINNAVRISITIMIHAELGCPDDSDKSLYTMAMSHSVHLHNHTTHISSGMSPDKVWERSKSSHSVLHNSRPWGYPSYVLELILKDGNKLPKWTPRYRRSQYLGSSPLYAITMGLERKIQTGNISPQFHFQFDDYFETLHAVEDQEPPAWSKLITFQSFNIAYNDKEYFPNLADEWLEPAALESRRYQEDQRQPKTPFQEEDWPS